MTAKTYFKTIAGILFLLFLVACSLPDKDPSATVLFSMHNLKSSIASSTVSQKTMARSAHTNVAAISFLQLDIFNRDSGEQIASQSVSLENEQAELQVPAGVDLSFSAKAFEGESIRFYGSVLVFALQAGERRVISLNLYSTNAEPVQVDIGVLNKSANGKSSGEGFSASRNYVLFSSDADNLIENDDNQIADIFLRDLDSNRIINLHTDSKGNLAKGNAIQAVTDAAISADGRFVVFSSTADNLVENITNNVSDVFLKDTLTDNTRRISLTSDKQEADAPSDQPDISENGEIIVFRSDASLTGGEGSKLYQYNRVTELLKPVLDAPATFQLSGDGKAIVYQSLLDNGLNIYHMEDSSSQSIVTMGESNNGAGIYRYAVDRQARFVVFSHTVDTDETRAGHFYLYDSKNAQKFLLSQVNGELLDVDAEKVDTPGISSDGRYFLFSAKGKIYLGDSASKQITPIAEGERPLLSLDGRRITYTDVTGRLLLTNNPLYQALSESPVADGHIISDISVDLLQPGVLEISWPSNADNTYYRVYVDTQSGVQPDNYFLRENAKQYETTENRLSLVLSELKSDNLYFVVTSVTANGESQPSVETVFNIPFLATRKNPLNNAVNVSPNINPEVTFNRPIDRRTAILPVIQLTGENGIVTGNITFPDDYSIRFNPSSPLLRGQQYELSVSTALLDVYGQPLSKNESIIFNTLLPAVQYYTVNVVVNGNGSYIQEIIGSIAEGDRQILSFVPDEGFVLAGVSGCEGLLENDSYVTAPIFNDCTVVATFENQFFQLNYFAANNGSITGNTVQNVMYGGDGSAVIAVPALGYQFVQWSDGSTDNPRTDVNITADKSVTANFAIQTFNLVYSAGANGSIVGNASQTINYGNNGTAVTASPNVGYEFINWSDGSTDNPRTDLNVTANLAVTANFAIKRFNLVYNAGANGVIVGNASQTINFGNNGTAVTASPNVGYDFVSWSDGSTDNPRTDLNVTANLAVTANFAIQTFNLVYNAGANGTIVGNTSQTVSYGGNGTAVRAEANPNYRFFNWSDGATNNPRTDINVTSALSVTANFVVNSAPVFDFPVNITINENETAVIRTLAFDVNNDSISYRISGGVDQALFAINNTTGDLFFKSAPDYEKPTDSDANNLYVVNVTANDGELDSKAAVVSITISNVKDVGFKLNDTGVVRCQSDTAFIACGNSKFPQQDAEAGRDKLFNDDTDGAAGFSFTKIAVDGTVLASGAANWACVRDNVTGLIWEKKTTAGGYQDYRSVYRWNGVSGYINSLNSNKFCGYTDWRLPFIDELLSLVDYSRNGPAVDKQYFPNTNIDKYYWSASERVSLQGSTYAYFVNFSTGYQSSDLKTNSLVVRLVRGNW